MSNNTSTPRQSPRTGAAAGTTTAPGLSHSPTVTFAPQIYIKTLTGTTFAIPFEPDMTVVQLKEKVNESQGIPVDQQRLIFNAAQMQDTATLKSLNVIDGSIIHLVLRVRGGIIGGRKKRRRSRKYKRRRKTRKHRKRKKTRRKSHKKKKRRRTRRSR